MFLDNKYTKIYYQLINKAKSENRIKTSVTHENHIYYELHHIMPSSICPELSDLKLNPENGVLLTAREHYIAHLLLVNMVESSIDKTKMAFALFRFTKHYDCRPNRILNSHQYSLAKKIHEKYLSLSYEIKYGEEKAKEIKKKQSISRTGSRNGMYGKKHSEETMIKLRAKAQERSNKTRGKTYEELYGEERAKEIKEKVSNNIKNTSAGKTYEELYGEERAKEIKEKLSKAGKGKKSTTPSKLIGTKHSKETIEKQRAAAKNRIKTQCPHCNRMLDPGNYKQFHGDKCKLKK